MIQSLESIRGAGGSVKVGTTGTISALMSRELESTKSASTIPLDSVPAGDSTPKKPKPTPSAVEASSSTMKSHKCPETSKKTKHYTGKSYQIPILTSDNISIDGTPIRQKPVKRVPTIVEVVDIKCRYPDKTWANPITNRLKKLGFSKLSDNVGT